MALLVACTESSAPAPAVKTVGRRPNVLLVTFDTTRADRLGPYGYEAAVTPTADRLAREGVRVEHAWATAPLTAPSHSSILTGLIPPAHGVRDNGSFALPDAVESLPELLGEAGYATGAFVSAAVLHRRYNLSQGFDVYDDELWSEDAPRMFMIRERPARRTVDRALEWLEDRSETEPFFAWVHFFEPHHPHEPAVADRIRTLTPYDAEVTGADRQLGRLLDWLEARDTLDDTLVILTADHGESMGEHGEDTHGVFVYQSTIRVPLLLRWPGRLPAGSVHDTPMSVVDIAPTVLAAAGVDLPPAMNGRSHLDPMTGGPPLPEVGLYSESLMSELGFGMAPLHAVRRDGLTYIRAPRPELYDRTSDPDELHDLHAERRDRAAALAEELDAMITRAEDGAPDASTRPIDRETLDMLRALGYVGDPAARDAVRGMDPKDGIGLYEAIHRARSAIRAQRYEAALAEVDQLLEATPRNVTAWNTKGLVHRLRHEVAPAREALNRSLEIDPQQPRPHLHLAQLDLEEGHLDEASRRLDLVEREFPGFLEAIVMQGAVAIARDDLDGAESAYERALALDPTYPRALAVYGDLAFRREDWTAAQRWYVRALEAAPEGFEVLNQLGATERRLGNAEEALSYYQRAAEVRPDSWIPPYNIGCLHAVQGDADAAIAALATAVERGLPTERLAVDPDLASLQGRPELERWRTARRAPR